MCHCFSELTEMSDKDRAEVVDEHSTEELRAGIDVDPEYRGDAITLLTPGTTSTSMLGC